VEIADLGERYRVRVTTESGVLERTYGDPERDCDKRRRFVAEFIVLSVLPPELAIEPGPTPVPPAPSGATVPPVASPPASASSPAPSTPRVPPSPPPVLPPLPSALPRASPSSTAPAGPSFARLELSLLGEASPAVVRSPGMVAWGADLRVRLGSGWLAGIAGVSYWPAADYVVSGVRGDVTRVPALAGLRLRARRRYFELAGDAGVAVAFERYAGESPHDPSDATRLAPGLEVGVLVSSPTLAGFAPFVGLRVDWFPLVQELAAAPQGNLGNTPSLWFGAAVGLSWER